MKSKMIGGVLLVTGTCIGGAMLALPIVVAQSGFISSSILLFFCWAIMTFCSFLILEVNLWLPENNNIISMVKATIGDKGAVVAWLSYLLLFYCLLAAYISSGADIFHTFMNRIGFAIPNEVGAILFLLLFGYVVYRGIQSIDRVNRLLMLTKGSTYVLLVGSSMVYLGSSTIPTGHPKYLINSATFMVTSYGFATIVPSLRAYFKNDVVSLRKAIVIGSFIPLVCYILWDFVVLSVIPSAGPKGLVHMLNSGHSTTELGQSLSYFLNNPWVTVFVHLFTSVCVATSFLGVSLGLTDFLADGFNLEKAGKNNILIYGVAFLPPLAMALFYPNAFIMGLNYAGIFCTVLLMLLPPLMAWCGRYRKNIAKGYQVPGGKLSLFIAIIIAVFVIILGIMEGFYKI